MLNKGIISVLCAFTTASTAISVGNAFSDLQSEDLLYREQFIDEDSEALCDSEYKCMLKEHNGNIAVIDVNGNISEIFYVPSVTLPMSERKKLEAGIKVKSDSELNKLREAYCE